MKENAIKERLQLLKDEDEIQDLDPRTLQIMEEMEDGDYDVPHDVLKHAGESGVIFETLTLIKAGLDPWKALDEAEKIRYQKETGNDKDDREEEFLGNKETIEAKIEKTVSSLKIGFNFIPGIGAGWCSNEADLEKMRDFVRGAMSSIASQSIFSGMCFD